MSSVIITKEQLTPFERWELASFDAHQAGKRPNSVAELESIRQQAYDEGYAEGRDAGYAAGIQQAHN